MSQQIEVENDPFLILLTDALRAGPGSPQWHEAVSKLKENGENVDEYRLLVEARQALESGKDYRSIRAGAGFTRKVMEGLEQQPAQHKPRISLASLIALLAGVLVIAIIVIAVVALWPKQQGGQDAKAIEELATTYFPTQALSADFTSGIPSGWGKIGALPVDAASGLRPSTHTAIPSGYIGGGVVSDSSFAPDQPLDVETSVRLNQPTANLIAQVFVSDSSDFSSDRAVSFGNELVWQVEGAAQKVVAAGRVEHQSKIAAKGQTHTIRILLRGDLAVVEQDNRRIWAGHSGLGSKPRYVGVRFIRTGEKATDDVSVQSIKVLKVGG